MSQKVIAEVNAVMDFIMAYEGGTLESDEQVFAGFQILIDEGLAWSLQGSYGRMARDLIEAGHCTASDEIIERFGFTVLA